MKEESVAHLGIEHVPFASREMTSAIFHHVAMFINKKIPLKVTHLYLFHKK